MRVRKDPDTPPLIRFYNRAAADQNVPFDRVMGQVYDADMGGYGGDLSLSALMTRAEKDPVLANQLSKIFMTEGIDGGFQEKFMKDVNFARLYADVEGERGAAQDYKTRMPKFRGDFRLPNNCGEEGAGASLACNPGLAKKLAKKRVAKGPSNKDKFKARLTAMLQNREAPTVRTTQSAGMYPRSGMQTPNEFREQVATSLADGSSNDLLRMLSAMPSGDTMFVNPMRGQLNYGE